MRINEYGIFPKDQDGTTVLAADISTAKKLALEMFDEFEIELIGSWDMDDWETIDRLEQQGLY